MTRPRRRLPMAICVAPYTIAAFALLAAGLLMGAPIPAGAAPDVTDPPVNSFTLTTQWSGPDNHFVTAIAEDRTGWWWGTDDDGLWHYAPDSKSAMPWTHVRAGDGLIDDSITALCIDRQGRLWAGTERRGVTVLSGDKMRNYDDRSGPLSGHVNGIAVDPVSGSIWMATDKGLSIYSDSGRKWRYITRADGLPADQLTCIAFTAAGRAIVGTACSGLLIGDAADGYRSWTHIEASPDAALAEDGPGLPSNQINCVIVNKAGKIFCGTSQGIASSTDNGADWAYLRGWQWNEKVPLALKQAGGTAAPYDKLPLADEFVSCLAYDKAGRLYIGHRQRGFEIYDDAPGKQLYHTRFDASGVDIRALAPFSGGGLLIGNYGGGISLVSMGPGEAVAESGPPRADKASALPPAAGKELGDARDALERFDSNLAAGAAGTGAWLGEDWLTQGDWVGRYGGQYAVLCAADGASDTVVNAQPGYTVSAQIGNSGHPDDFSRWLEWPQTSDPRILFDPKVNSRREAEWDDHGERYPMTYEGPDLWLAVTVPAGAHRVSLYFVNKDGHTGVTRYRDYLVDLKTYSESVSISQSYLATPDPLPTLAECRVSNFWPGVYESFVVSGPDTYYIKIAKNASLTTILQGVFVDGIGKADARSGKAGR